MLSCEEDYDVPRKLDRGLSLNLPCLEHNKQKAGTIKRSYRRQHSGEGRALALLEALEGKRTIKETTSTLAGCGKLFWYAKRMLKKSPRGVLDSLPGAVKRETRVSREAVALLGTRRVSARQGWAGEKYGLFEHPARCSLDVLDVWAIESPSCHNSFSADS